MADYRDQILSLAQAKPLLPGDVAKSLNTDLIMASAMLSELSANKKLRISRLKVGSSPLYFIPEKESMLENYTNSLNEKDRKTVEILKMNKILRDSALDPLTRVSLRQISDFSKPIEVKQDGQSELFWKWFLTSDSEAELMIRQIIEPSKPEIKSLPVVQKDAQLHLVDLNLHQESVALVQNVEKKVVAPSQTHLEKPISKNTFFASISSFFGANKIKVIEQKEIKKLNDYDFIVELPSSVGMLTYYCKARNKKKIVDADVSNAFVQGQLKKLPVILLSNGELHKNAKELLQQLKGVYFQKI